MFLKSLSRLTTHVMWYPLLQGGVGPAGPTGAPGASGSQVSAKGGGPGVKGE